MPIERRNWKRPNTGVILRDQDILDIANYFRRPEDRSLAGTVERMVTGYAFEHLSEATEPGRRTLRAKKEAFERVARE